MAHNQRAIRMAWVEPQLVVGTGAFLSIRIELFQETVEVGTAPGSRDVKEEEQILEVQFVSASVALPGRVRPALDSPLAAGVVFVVSGAGKRKQGH